jgi:hypothetical protein
VVLTTWALFFINRREAKAIITPDELDEARPRTAPFVAGSWCALGKDTGLWIPTARRRESNAFYAS